jgi:hypothetical protein
LPLLVLSCNQNQLTTLNIGNSTSLQNIYCSNNQLTTLDLRNTSGLTSLFCSNNLLTSLYIQNGSFEENLVISGNSNLAYICADADEIEFVNEMLTYYNIPNCTVNSQCSLETPNFETPVAIKLFPNPASDFINFNIEPVEQVKSIEIYNLMGQLMQSIVNPTTTTLLISEFKKGLYFVNFKLEDKILSTKFIKE